MNDYTRVPPPPERSMVIGQAGPGQEIFGRLVAFNRAKQVRDLVYFARLRLQWEADNPGRQFPGLCAEVDSVTGRFRSLSDQRAWSWGDARAVGIWSYFLQKGVVPDEDVDITLSDGRTERVNLRAFYEGYVDHIYECIAARRRENGGKLPFLVDVATGKASDDPRNMHPSPEEFTSTHIFAINAFFQYGLLRGNEDAIGLGRQTLQETVVASRENRFIDHLTRQRPYLHTHGRDMVTVGAIVDTLKTIEIIMREGDRDLSDLKDELVAVTRWTVDASLGYYWDSARRIFSEYLDPRTMTPPFDEAGRIVCDPGHAAEAAGFYAELWQYLPEDDASNFKFGRANMLPVLCDMLRFVHERGYSEKGVLFKKIDALSGEGLPDAMIGGRPYRTAPWWNLCELCAAAARLYRSTGQAFLWDIYRKAFDSVHANYPNERIGGLMVQTLDADTLEPLPHHPATGNLDPMHSARAREREIEALYVKQ